MTGILKIELPDDFKKGDCEKCPIYSNNDVVVYGVDVKCGYFNENCPLEVEEKCNSCKHFLQSNIECLMCRVDCYEPKEKDQ